jgi:hypothetical protein
MVRIGGESNPTTGGEATDDADRLEKARERGRRAAVATVTDDGEAATAATDGYVSPAALKLAARQPSLEAEDVVKWDRRTESHRQGDDVVLPARGPDGDTVTNLARSAVIAEYRAAIAEYRDLEGRTGDES